VVNDGWCQHLEHLISQACAVGAKSATRRRLSDRVVRHLQSRNIPYSQSYDRAAMAMASSAPEARRAYLLHQEAASQTWFHFLQNLCECQTRNTESSYLNQACLVIVRRLRKYYSYRLQDLKQQDQIKRQQTVTPVNQAGEILNLEDILIAPPNEPDLLNEICQWIQADQSGSLRQTYLGDNPKINAQAVLLRRICQDQPGRGMAVEFGLTPGNLTSFFQQRCLPLLRQFMEDQGYVNSVPPIPTKSESPNFYQELGEWLATDPTGKLRSIHLPKHPHITAQRVLLYQHNSQKSLKEAILALCQEHNLKPARLKAFYYRQCKPLLAEFGNHPG
jgi:hypothetical protein